MLAKSGTIYSFTDSRGLPAGIPVEETPDDIEEKAAAESSGGNNTATTPREYLGRVLRGEIKSTGPAVASGRYPFTAPGMTSRSVKPFPFPTAKLPSRTLSTPQAFAAIGAGKAVIQAGYSDSAKPVYRPQPRIVPGPSYATAKPIKPGLAAPRAFATNAASVSEKTVSESVMPVRQTADVPKPAAAPGPSRMMTTPADMATKSPVAALKPIRMPQKAIPAVVAGVLRTVPATAGPSNPSAVPAAALPTLRNLPAGQITQPATPATVVTVLPATPSAVRHPVPPAQPAVTGLPAMSPILLRDAVPVPKTIPIAPADRMPSRTHTTHPANMTVPAQPMAASGFTPIIVPALPSGATVWQRVGAVMILISVGGFSLPYIQKLRLETAYRAAETKKTVSRLINPKAELPPSAPVLVNPLLKPDGTEITPINTEFSLIIPGIGVNAQVVANVNPGNSSQYNEALEKGVAHAAGSMTPDQVGTVYLFSHSTNYEWFVRDLNAIFYLLKNMKEGESIVIFYKGVRYTYAVREKRIVKPNKVAYMVPDTERKSLILQTCWPPGSTTERMLIFADLIEEHGEQI